MKYVRRGCVNPVDSLHSPYDFEIKIFQKIISDDWWYIC